MKNKLHIIAGRVYNDARANASYNPTLTTYAQSVAADIDTTDADYLAPEVQVPSSNGFYKEYSQKDQIALYETSRAIGGKSNRISFNADDPRYYCKPHALETTVDEAERNASPDAGDSLEKGKIKTVVQAFRRARLYRVLTAVRASLTAVAGKGSWADPAKDPIKEINEQIFAIAQATGLLPNRVWIDMIAWAKLVDHPKVIARVGGAEVASIDVPRFTRLLTLNPAIQVKIGASIYDQAKPGATKNSKFMGNGDVFVFYAEDNASQMDPSLAKTFTMNANGVGDVYQYREEPFLDVYNVSATEEVKVTASVCGRRITVAE